MHSSKGVVEGLAADAVPEDLRGGGCGGLSERRRSEGQRRNRAESRRKGSREEGGRWKRRGVGVTETGKGGDELSIPPKAASCSEVEVVLSERVERKNKKDVSGIQRGGGTSKRKGRGAGLGGTDS